MHLLTYPHPLLAKSVGIVVFHVLSDLRGKPHTSVGEGRQQALLHSNAVEFEHAAL